MEWHISITWKLPFARKLLFPCFLPFRLFFGLFLPPPFPPPKKNLQRRRERRLQGSSQIRFLRLQRKKKGVSGLGRFAAKKRDQKVFPKLTEKRTFFAPRKIAVTRRLLIQTNSLSPDFSSFFPEFYPSRRDNKTVTRWGYKIAHSSKMKEMFFKKSSILQHQKEAASSARHCLCVPCCFYVSISREKNPGKFDGEMRAMKKWNWIGWELNEAKEEIFISEKKKIISVIIFAQK